MEDPRSIKKFSIVREISSLITETNNINALANLLLDHAIDYTNAEKGSLMLINENNELYILAARGFDVEFIETYRIKIGEGIAGIVVQNRSPVLVKDIDKDERFYQKKRDRYKTRAFISSPLISRNKVLGVININDKKDGTPFTEDELDLLNIIADQAAIALENAFLMNQSRTKAIELEDINRKLLESDINKTEFITRISHELRSPLNSIKGATYYLQQSEKQKKSKQKEFYDLISNETEGLISIVENLLDFLRLESETTPVRTTLINLENLLKEVSESKGLNKIFSEKNIKFKLDIKKDTYEIIGDKVRLSHLFINLLEGLSHYLQNGDTIDMKISKNEFIKADMKLSRSMPEIVLSFLLYGSKYIFHSDWSDEKMKLYLARRVAEAHGWGFEVKNIDNTFLVSITISTSTKEKLDALINMSMNMFVEVISELMDINICSIMLSDNITGDLTIKGVKGLSDEIVKRTRIRFGDQIAGWVASEGKPLLIEDIETNSRFKRDNIPQYNTKSLLSLPLKLEEKIIGVLNLNNKRNAAPFNKKDLYIASAFSERITYILKKFYSSEQKDDDINQIINSLDNLVYAVKNYKKKKSIFPDLVLRIMDKLGTEDKDKEDALYVSIIYDLGLALINNGILKKKTLLPSEIQALKIHPYTTIEILNNFEFSDNIKEIILSHHENFDGTGYPKGLKGDEIPLISRIIAVVDSYCAMISERPYGSSLTWEKALSEIKVNSGSRYDPEIVRIFEEVLREAIQKD
ncbi:MAG: GAF domain-containing protein [Nitrospirota bacterium]